MRPANSRPSGLRPSFDRPSCLRPSDVGANQKLRAISATQAYIGAPVVVTFNRDVELSDAATTVASGVSLDAAILNSTNADTNYGDAITVIAEVAGESDGRTVLGIIIPANRTVSACVLDLKISSMVAASNSLRASLVDVDIATAPVEDTVTWNTPWVTPGGDVEAAHVDFAVATGDTHAVVDLSTLAVAAQTAGLSTFYVLIQAIGEAPEGVLFHSKEAVVAANRPSVSITSTQIALDPSEWTVFIEDGVVQDAVYNEYTISAAVASGRTVTLTLHDPGTGTETASGPTYVYYSGEDAGFVDARNRPVPEFTFEPISIPQFAAVPAYDSTTKTAGRVGIADTALQGATPSGTDYACGEGITRCAGSVYLPFTALPNGLVGTKVPVRIYVDTANNGHVDKVWGHLVSVPSGKTPGAADGPVTILKTFVLFNNSGTPIATSGYQSFTISGDTAMALAGGVDYYMILELQGAYCGWHNSVDSVDYTSVWELTGTGPSTSFGLSTTGQSGMYAAFEFETLDNELTAVYQTPITDGATTTVRLPSFAATGTQALVFSVTPGTGGDCSLTVNLKARAASGSHTTIAYLKFVWSLGAGVFGVVSTAAANLITLGVDELSSDNFTIILSLENGYWEVWLRNNTHGQGGTDADCKWRRWSEFKGTPAAAYSTAKATAFDAISITKSAAGCATYPVSVVASRDLFVEVGDCSPNGYTGGVMVQQLTRKTTMVNATIGGNQMTQPNDSIRPVAIDYNDGSAKKGRWNDLDDLRGCTFMLIAGLQDLTQRLAGTPSAETIALVKSEYWTALNAILSQQAANMATLNSPIIVIGPAWRPATDRFDAQTWTATQQAAAEVLLAQTRALCRRYRAVWADTWDFLEINRNYIDDTGIEISYPHVNQAGHEAHDHPSDPDRLTAVCEVVTGAYEAGLCPV